MGNRMLSRSQPIRKHRAKPRKGRVIDKDYLAWLAKHPCIVAGHVLHECSGPVTLHHVRRYGEQKSDHRALPLCQGHHLHDFGMHSIERLGKRIFQMRYGVDLIRSFREAYRTR